MIIVIHIYNRITIGTTTIAPVPPPATNPDNNDKEVVFENFASFTDCKSEINNTQIDNAKEIDVVMPMYNLVVYVNNYSKASGSLWKYYRDEPALTNAGAIANFHAVDNSASLKINKKITGKSADSGTKDIEIMVPLKYLSNFWRILEMPLTNCDINNILSWSGKWMLSNDTKATIFAITDTKLNVSVVTVSTQDNINLFQHLKSGFKRTIE